MLRLANPEATAALGAALAQLIKGRAGAVIFLRGDLGAGKTTLARGLLREIGITGAIRSPTYTLIEPYSADGREILHMDLYRLQDAEELHQLGLVDYPPSQTLWLVEWPDRGGDQLPSPDISVALSACADQRDADIVGLSKVDAARLKALLTERIV